MNKQIIKSDALGEQYSVIHHPSGLDVLVWKMEGFSTTEALFGTRYGSINTRFKTDKTNGFIDVPEGIAHYLEHKLFENEDSDVIDLYAATGASANAFTSFDQTAYTFSASDNWEAALEILLDFVQKPYFTQENVDKERGIIAQEIKMYDDSPERQCFLNLIRAMYVNHPVRIDIAGTVESISQITPELLYDCYNSFYNLHNMVLAIAGNVDEQKVIEICDRVLKPSEDIKLETDFPQEPLSVCQKRVITQFPVGAPIFSIGFKSKPCIGVEYERKSIIKSMLLQLLIGATSPLHQQLFEEGLINSQFGFQEFSSTGATVQSSFFSVIISGESHDPEEVYRRLTAEIERVKREGLDEERFELVKKSKYGDIVRSLNNVENCANSMMDSYFNGTSVFESAIELARITPQDCLDALDELLNVDNSAISIVKS